MRRGCRSRRRRRSPRRQARRRRAMKLISALALFLLAGCGTDTSSQTATNARNPAGAGPAAVSLGSAGDPGAAGSYVVLAKTGISTVPGSAVTGDIGLSPAAASFVTGFSLIADATNVFATSTQVSGKVFA